MRYLFVTDDYIRRSHAVHRQNSAFQRAYSYPVIEATRPHEHGVLAYGTVIRDGGRYRAWYQVLNRDTPGVPRPYQTAVGYAESLTGTDWKKPKLRLFPYQGSPTNLVLLNSGRSSLFSPTVIVNSNKKIADKYLMLFFDAMNEQDLRRRGSPFPDEPAVPGWVPISGEGLFLARSNDGLHWRRDQRPVIGGQVDSSVLYQLRDGRLLAVFKTTGTGDRHYRVIAAAMSDDGRRWTKPKVILRPDHRDTLGTEFYTLVPFEFHGNLLGLLSVYHNSPHDKSLTIQLVRASNPERPLDTWDRANDREPIFFPTGKDDWDGGRVYPSSNLLKGLGRDQDDLFLYYGGATTTHDDRRHWESAIGLAQLIKSRFSSLAAGFHPGWFEMKPIPLRRPKLELDIQNHGGNLGIELFDQSGRRCLFRKDLSSSINRKNHQNSIVSIPLPSKFFGMTVRPKIWLRRCEVYSVS